MTISYNWLKEYIDVELPVEKVAELLTDTGLEVEGVSRIESIKGGLEKVVVGEVLTCEPHPNADRLRITTVNVGQEEPLQIVCGAPNVAAGQKVPVAMVGAILYGMGDPLKIKKGKIRGEVSLGMICAEDELGLGEGHDGIMVLSEDAKPGQPAAEYFNIENDEAIEIGLTPNRTDAMGHFGVARDLRAALAMQGIEAKLQLPHANFQVQNQNLHIPIEVENTEACPQYLGVSIANVEVKESPEWLRNKLTAIGLKPKNNVVDVTNFVLHELGHPLHAFDADKIEGKKVVVRNAQNDEKFITLDGEERTLNENDLMICDAQKPMCIAGVLGGEYSGVSESTKNVFLEAAWFAPVSIRKTAKRHGLNTDASYRYERGVDPNLTRIAMQRAVALIQEVAGGTVSSNVQEAISKSFPKNQVQLNLKRLNQLIGNDIAQEKVVEILHLLDFEILSNNGEDLLLTVPTYRVDVTREADVVEEVLRIYGFNNIELPQRMHISLSDDNKFSSAKLRKSITQALTANGVTEIMNNSLTKLEYYESCTQKEQLVHILNPLSQDLNVMRQNLIFGGLEVVSHNINRQTSDIKICEFGNVYIKEAEGKYRENEQLMILLTGNASAENWQAKTQVSSFYHAKAMAQMVLEKLGISGYQERIEKIESFDESIILGRGNKTLASVGVISAELLAQFDIDQPVFVAILDWDAIVKAASRVKIKYQPLTKFPAVRRDLALLVDVDMNYAQMKVAAQKAGGKLVKEINLFDVYVGKNLPKGKKSYAMSFLLQDEAQTLVDKKTDAVMDKILASLQKQCGATLR